MWLTITFLKAPVTFSLHAHYNASIKPIVHRVIETIQL